MPRQKDVNGPADKIGRPVLSLPGPVLSLPGIFFMPECDMTIRLGHWQQVCIQRGLSGVFNDRSSRTYHGSSGQDFRAPRQAVVTLRRIIVEELSLKDYLAAFLSGTTLAVRR